MARAFKELKGKHNILIRNMVRAVGHLQWLMDDGDTPEHVKPRLMTCLELLDRGLLGLAMEDELVRIKVVNGTAYVAFKSEYVDVSICDLNEAWGKAQ